MDILGNCAFIHKFNINIDSFFVNFLQDCLLINKIILDLLNFLKELS